MEFEGNLLKMSTSLQSPIKYQLRLNDKLIVMNELLGKKVTISFLNTIHCINCGKVTKKSFSQGFCYPCFIKVPQTDPGVIRPELNRAHDGVSRDMEWSKKNDLIDHFVYLAVTSDVKVGVTRSTQIPTRWIDQGAAYAIKLAKTPYRQLAGLIEVELKNYMKDKTNWRKMLTSEVKDAPNLLDLKDEYANLLPVEYQEFIADDDSITHLEYPVLHYPEKVKSIGLDKTPTFSATLTGIKGQYLMFDSGLVFNVRKHNGYKVKLTLD